MKSRLASEVSRQNDKGLMELAHLRQGYYRFSGALFLYPDEERLGNLVGAARELQNESNFLAVFPFFGPWRRLLATLQELTDAEEVEEEYVRLFVVNPQAPPYESSYLDPRRRATGWITAGLAREYIERGLALSPSLQEPPDHVAVELELMSFLCNLEAQAWERGDLKEASQVLRSQRGFLGLHLERWFPAFARQVAAAGRDGLYVLAAEAAGALIHHDRDLVDLLLQR
jgi:TorA-specific chaperone